MQQVDLRRMPKIKSKLRLPDIVGPLICHRAGPLRRVSSMLSEHFAEQHPTTE